MKITSEEIAKLANVSRSTVSRVINNYPNVPEKTRRKVLEIIEEYDYIPNSSARVLAGKTNNIIALFIGDIGRFNENVHGGWRGANSEYFVRLISEVIGESKKRGYMVLVYVITNVSEFKQIEHTFINRTICGGIFVGFEYNSPEINNMINKKYNIVLIDQVKSEDNIKKVKRVNCKNGEGAYMATKYLIDNGHKNIAHISGDGRLSSIERYNGYIKALKDHNYKIEEKFIVKGEYREDVSYRVTKELLKYKEVTAILAANDILAMGAIRAIKDAGLRIYDDISIIGFDNLEFAKRLDIELTTMDVSAIELARESVKLLLSDDKDGCALCKPHMIVRNSVKNIKSD